MTASPAPGVERLSGLGKTAGAVGVMSAVMGAIGAMTMMAGTVVAFLMGLLLLRRHGRAFVRFVRSPGTLAVIATGLSLTVWFASSALWSPVPQGDALYGLSWQLPVSLVAVFVLVGAGRADHTASVRGLVAAVAGAAFILACEALNGYAGYRMASPEQEVLELERTLGRGAVVVVVLSWLAVLACVRLGLDRRVAVGLALLAGFVSTRFGMDLNAILFVLGGAAAMLAYALPRLALGLMFGGSALVVLGAPWIYARLADMIVAVWPNQDGPLSWERRAQMWDYAIARIQEAPVRGWGLDASRQFDGKLTYRGFEWANIQLHPHATPVQIWLELGGIGAALTALLLAAAGYAAIRAFGQDRLAAAGLCASCAMIFAAFAVSFGAWQPWLWAVLTLAIGWSLALRRLRPAYLDHGQMTDLEEPRR